MQDLVRWGHWQRLHFGVRDNRRDNAAAADGIFTLRYGWADVTERPCETAREVAAVLGQRGWPGPLRRCGPGCRA
jgi:hypothetical protein